MSDYKDNAKLKAWLSKWVMSDGYPPKVYFHYEDDGESFFIRKYARSQRQEEFEVQQALFKAQRYDDQSALIEVIKKGLRPLLEYPYNEALAAYMQGSHKGKGINPGKSQRDDKRNHEILKLVYRFSKALPIWDVSQATDACREVGKIKCLSAKQVHRIYKNHKERINNGDKAAKLFSFFHSG